MINHFFKFISSFSPFIRPSISLRIADILFTAETTSSLPFAVASFARSLSCLPKSFCNGEPNRLSMETPRYEAISAVEIKSGSLLRALQLDMVGYLISVASAISESVLCFFARTSSTLYQKISCRFSSFLFTRRNITTELCCCQCNKTNVINMGRFLLTYP